VIFVSAVNFPGGLTVMRLCLERSLCNRCVGKRLLNRTEMSSAILLHKSSVAQSNSHSWKGAVAFLRYKCYHNCSLPLPRCHMWLGVFYTGTVLIIRVQDFIVLKNFARGLLARNKSQHLHPILILQLPRSSHLTLVKFPNKLQTHHLALNSQPKPKDI
jgi:hypothetical protein